MKKKIITVVKAEKKVKLPPESKDITRKRLMRLFIHDMIDWTDKDEFTRFFNKLPFDSKVKYIGQDMERLGHYYVIQSKLFPIRNEGSILPNLMMVYKDGKLDHYEW